MDFDKSSTVKSKLCAMALFSISSIIFGLSPMFILSHLKKRKLELCADRSKKSKYKRILSHMSAFGGGVLLSTTFLHLLPEIRESIESLQFKQIVPNTKSMPLAELLMCIGFLFLYLIEEVAHRISHKHDSPVNDNNDCVVGFVNNVYSNTNQGCNRIEFHHDSSSTKANCVPVDDGLQKEIIGNVKNGKDVVEDIAKEGTPLHRTESKIFFTEGSGKNFLLIFALSIHEGFEGLAIGLEPQPDAVWYMILGVGAHKAVIAFCIGVQMVSSNLNRKVAILYVSLFATATSLGVAIGLFLYKETGIMSIILQGLATGTLLHVVFFEMLTSHSDDTKSPFSGVFLGFTCMAVLKYFSP